MTPDDFVPRTPPCPSPEELADFDRGRLPWEQLEVIGEHLSACRSCESTLERLQGKDTIAVHLRRDSALLSHGNEPACQRLEDRARAIPLEHAGTATVTDAKSSAPPDAPPLPVVFGAYQLLERLGQGGMGVVYKARQEKLKRLVALKMVRAGVYASPEERLRFQREGEVIAQVRHAHVVQIHEFNEHDGQMFFSMELLEGGTLSNRLNGSPLPQREAAELVRTLARAVQAAHDLGIVHRDLKPSNVLFAADGTPKITDFGLAKVLDAEDSDTRSDAILGTPAYMAPEQARGESRTVGPAADVYALGTILYEALTGQPPFRAETRYQTIELVRACEPEAPSRRRPELARDLEAIVLKCLEEEPSRRYPSAAALADDLDRWLGGEPTHVRPLSRTGRAWRAVRRRPRMTAAIALLALLAVMGSLAWYRYDPERPIRNIERRLERGEEVVLIGETGKPAWYSFPKGVDTAQVGDTVQVSMAGDGTFTVHAWSPTLLELVRDPRRESYRLRAEVRQRKAASGAQVGLYVLERSFDTSLGTAHSLIYWTFNDLYDLRERFADVQAQFTKRTGRVLRQPAPPGNYVAFHSHLYLEKRPPEAAWGFSMSLGASGIEPAAATGKRDWRQLAVEVTPRALRGFWEGELAYELSFADLAEKTRHVWRSHNQKRPGNPITEEDAVNFSPRGKLGFYVQNSSVSFRRVVIEPLENPE